jgi:hypothetical protein
MTYGVWPCATSPERTQPVAPFGFEGSKTCTQPSVRAIAGSQFSPNSCRCELGEGLAVGLVVDADHPVGVDDQAGGRVGGVRVARCARRARVRVAKPASGVRQRCPRSAAVQQGLFFWTVTRANASSPQPRRRDHNGRQP